MAMGSDLTLLGSEDHNTEEILCAPCLQDQKRTDAEKYCQTCLQNFCTECLQQHNRFNGMKSHILSEKKDTRSIYEESIGYKCKTHTNMSLEIYSQDCNQLSCSIGAATEHSFLDMGDREPDLKKRKITTSTPLKVAFHVSPHLSEVSSLTESAQDSETTMTATEQSLLRSSEGEMEAGPSSGRKSTNLRTIATTRAGRVVQQMESSSFINPMNLSLDFTLTEQEDECDPDYDPLVDISASLPDEVMSVTEDVPFEEMEFGLEKGDGEEELYAVDEELGPGVQRLRCVADSLKFTQAQLCLAYVDQVKVLAGTTITKCNMKDCHSSNIRIKESFTGSAFYLKWICEYNHKVHTWCSQPVMNHGLHAGDLITAFATLTSGNNYSKLALWARHLNLKILSSNVFNKLQAAYLVPMVDQYWKTHQTKLFEEFRGKELVLLGDGRNDSPGHSAQYCSYTLMEESTKKILTLRTLDKRMTERKSAAMEKSGFIFALEEVKENGLNVSEVVTDAHLGITSYMKNRNADMERQNEPSEVIFHSHDIWHAAKNLGKRLAKIVSKKENRILIPWQKDIVNHFWFSCQTANDYEEFVCIWRSVLHHVTDCHEWIITHGRGVNHCLHEPLVDTERDKPWLHPSKDCAALKNLTAIVLDKRMLSKVSYYLRYRSTSDLESFHQLILMYCAKRYAYTPPVYRIRNLLAALDHNHHADRPMKLDKHGEQRYHRCYNKKSKRWTVRPVKEDKDYSYIKEMKEKLFMLRITDKHGIYKSTILEEDDPRRISKTLSEEKAPPTKQLVELKKSRFLKK